MYHLYQENCYYHGHIQDLEDSSVSVTICSGIRYHAQRHAPITSCSLQDAFHTFPNGYAIVLDAMFVCSWTAAFCPLSIEVLLGWKSKYTWLNPWPTTLMEIMRSISTNIWGGREALVVNQTPPFMSMNHQWLSP